MKRKFYFILLSFLVICCLKSSNVFATLQIYTLDYDMVVNTDGSIDVTETWDMYINEVNTIFKTFEYDSSKFSTIENVSVKNLTDNIQYKDGKHYQYHVDPNTYYGLDNKNGEFEIAWYAGFDEDSGYKKYQIKYTVTDAVAVYNDYAEIYWKLVGDNGGIAIDKINFTMHLPDETLKEKDMKVWTHVATLKGISELKNGGKVEAMFWEVPSNTFVEVRTLFPTENVHIFSERKYKKDILDEVVAEETKWAHTANVKRATKNLFGTIFGGIISILTAIVSVWQIKQFAKDSKGIIPKRKPTVEYKYFRELPREDASPSQALALMANTSTPVIDLGKAFSATLMMLDVKKYIRFSMEKNQKGKDEVYIEKIDETPREDLTSDEKMFYDYLLNIMGEKTKISMKEIKDYISLHSSGAIKLNNHIKSNLEIFLGNRYIDKEQNDKRNSIMGIGSIGFIVGMFGWVFFGITMPDYPTVFSTIVCWALILYSVFAGILFIISLIKYNRTNLYEQKGVDEQNQWLGFKKYMEDFSLLKDQELPALVLWERYLAYATAFGISKKVIKQLKVKYPEYEDGSYYSTGHYCSYMYLASSDSFNSIFEKSISSVSGAMSSGSGTGGGSSGGGGGGGGGGSSGGR